MDPAATTRSAGEASAPPAAESTRAAAAGETAETSRPRPTEGAARARAVPVRYRPVLLAAVLVLLALLFRELATLVLAVLITVIVAIPLSAVATQLERLRVPRPLGAVLALLLGLSVLGGVFALVVPPLVSEIDALIAALPEIGDSLSEMAGSVTGGGPDELGNNLQQWVQGLIDSPEQLVGPLASVGLNVAGVIGALILIVVTAVLIASRPEPLLEGSLRLVPPGYRDTGDRVVVRLREAWVGWLKGVLVDMVVSGVLLYAGLAIVGLDFALAFAVISALLVVIPYFGSVLGGLPPVLFALTESPSKALLVLVVYLIVQQIEGNVIVPVVMSRAVQLHAAVVAIGVVIVGQLFGIVGLFIAVPILSTVMILVQELWVHPLERAESPAPGPPDEASGAPPTRGPSGPTRP